MTHGEGIALVFVPPVHHQTVSNEALVPTFNNLITNVRVIEPSSQREET